MFFDSFMDALGYYIEWRGNVKRPGDFVARLLKIWGVGKWVPELPDSTLKVAVRRSLPRLLINDDASISIALSELVVSNRIRKGLAEKAVAALDRQMTDLLLEARGFENVEEAQAIFEDVKELILASSGR